MPSTPAHSCPRYRPRSATNPLKEIVENHLEELLRVYDQRFRDTYGPMHPRVKDSLEAFTRCGDPHFGFLRLRCPDCGENKLLPFSCKARGLCPSCGQKRALAWAERMVEEVLPDVPYLQLVFTIPKMLRRAFLFDRSLYGELARAAYAAMREFFAAQFPALDRPVPAVIVGPQSFGSLLNAHPHAHAVSSLGVFDREGNFHPAPTDLDFSPLEQLFREQVFSFLLEKERITPERIALLRSWRNSGFNIDASRRVAAGDRHALDLLRALHGALTKRLEQHLAANLTCSILLVFTQALLPSSTVALVRVEDSRRNPVRHRAAAVLLRDLQGSLQLSPS